MRQEGFHQCFSLRSFTLAPGPAPPGSCLVWRSASGPSPAGPPRSPSPPPPTAGRGPCARPSTPAAHDGDGDVITFDPTVFAARQTIPVSSALFADAGVTIQGPAAGVVLDGSGNGQQGLIFESDTATSAVSNVTIQNFSKGTGLDNRFGTVTATHCVIQDNYAENGGGVFNDGTMTLIGCTVAGNSVQQGGGGIFSYGTLTLTGCTLSGNTSGGPGGGIYNGNGERPSDADRLHPRGEHCRQLRRRRHLQPGQLPADRHQLHLHRQHGHHQRRRLRRRRRHRPRSGHDGLDQRHLLRRLVPPGRRSGDLLQQPEQRQPRHPDHQ